MTRWITVDFWTYLGIKEIEILTNEYQIKEWNKKRRK